MVSSRWLKARSPSTYPEGMSYVLLCIEFQLIQEKNLISTNLSSVQQCFIASNCGFHQKNRTLLETLNFNKGSLQPTTVSFLCFRFLHSSISTLCFWSSKTLNFKSFFYNPHIVSFKSKRSSWLFIFTRNFYTRLQFSSNRIYCFYWVHSGTNSRIVLMCHKETTQTKKPTTKEVVVIATGRASE